MAKEPSILPDCEVRIPEPETEKNPSWNLKDVLNIVDEILRCGDPSQPLDRVNTSQKWNRKNE